MELGNVRGPIPIHGYLSGANGWKVVEAKADARGAWVTHAGFYRNPAYMKQFPFAHTLTMTYRVANGALEVHTRIDNLSTEPMPVSIGFHPSFQLSDSKRSAWTLDVGAKTHLLLTDAKVPTGQTEAAAASSAGDPPAAPLRGADRRRLHRPRTRRSGARAHQHPGETRGADHPMAPSSGPQSSGRRTPTPPRAPGAAPSAGAAPPPPTPPVSVGPPVPLSATERALPWDQGFVAIEPMVGITNAMNAAQEGRYKNLQSIPPGGAWEESFWVEPTGF